MTIAHLQRACARKIGPCRVELDALRALLSSLYRSAFGGATLASSVSQPQHGDGPFSFLPYAWASRRATVDSVTRERIAFFDELHSLDTETKELVRPSLVEAERIVAGVTVAANTTVWRALMGGLLVWIALVLVVVALCLLRGAGLGDWIGSLAATLIFPPLALALLIAWFASTMTRHARRKSMREHPQALLAHLILSSAWDIERYDPNPYRSITRHAGVTTFGVIGRLESESRELHQTNSKRLIIETLEDAARTVERGCVRQASPGDPATDAWMRETARGIANAFRIEKRRLFTLGTEAAERLARELSSRIVVVSEGNWLALPQLKDFPNPQTRLRRVASFARKVPIALGPLAVVAGLVFMGVLSGAIATTLLIAASVWALTGLASGDASLKEQVVLAKDILGLVNR
jgi:hypothetical protein